MPSVMPPPVRIPRRSSGSPQTLRSPPRSRGVTSAGFSPRPASPPATVPAHSSALIAEWLAGVVIIGISVPLAGPTTGYGELITKIMWRMTGLTGVFFTLALIGTSPRASKVAITIGFLVDILLLVQASRSGLLRTVTSVFGVTSTTGTAGALPASASITEPRTLGLAGDLSGAPGPLAGATVGA